MATYKGALTFRSYDDALRIISEWGLDFDWMDAAVEPTDDGYVIRANHEQGWRGTLSTAKMIEPLEEVMIHD